MRGNEILEPYRLIGYDRPIGVIVFPFFFDGS